MHGNIRRIIYVLVPKPGVGAVLELMNNFTTVLARRAGFLDSDTNHNTSITDHRSIFYQANAYEMHGHATSHPRSVLSDGDLQYGDDETVADEYLHTST